MRDYHMSERAAMKYPLNRAFVLSAAAALRNPWCEMEIDGLGYIAQEAERRN